MPDATHTPSRDKPWVRVRDADGHEFDRAYFDPGIESGAFAVIADYAPNDTPEPRPHKYKVDLKGEALDAALAAAGLPATGRADEKRDRLAEHEASGAGPGDVTSTGA